nr:hypothetical protein [uncultured Cohaesibacter sp.]
MSSIIFQLAPDEILIATDTLAAKTDGSPVFFASKAIYLPHLRTIVAGSGAAGVSSRWIQHINDRMLLSGIHNLAYHAPSALQKIWNEYRQEFDIPSSVTSTIYHLGISDEDDNCMVGYINRSTSGFASEQMDYGWRYRPDCTWPEGETDALKMVQMMMQEQRELQAERPLSERIQIGGECMAWHLTKDGCASFRVFEFDDHKAQRQEALNNF